MAAGTVRRVFVATLLVTGLLARLARAAGPRPDKMECIAADTDGQALRLAGNLIQARKRLAVCAAASCPGIVRDDCVERIAEVEVAQPTVLFTATNGDGRPLVAVGVTVDGTKIAERLDGRPLSVDPGEHVFGFEALGRLKAQMLLTLNEGQKKVRRAVVLRASSGDPADQVPAPEPLSAADRVAPASLPVPAPTTPPSTSPADASPPVRESAPLSAGPTAGDADSTWRAAAIAAAGLGAVGVVVGSVFGLSARTKWNEVKGMCNMSECPDTARPAVSSALTDGHISNVAFIAAGASLAVGAWLWFLPPESTKTRVGVSVLPTTGPPRCQLSIRGSF